jgi:spermidine/putrescine transport system ATP-binding protein
LASYAIECKGLAVSLDGKQIFKDVNFEVQEGQCLALLGPSGCGKTTLLRVVAGFVRPDAGIIKLFGNAMGNEPPERRPVNMLFQKPPFFEEKTVEENALFGLQRGKDRVDAIQRIKHLAEVFDAVSFLKARVGTLSGGERQRAAFIRSFANARKIMLLDEPIHSAFDLHQRRVLLTALKECSNYEQLTTIVVTHEYDEAAYLSNNVLVLTNGESSTNSLREMYEDPMDLNVARILGYGNQVEARVMLDLDRRAQESPIRISGTLKNDREAEWAFFRPESVDVSKDGNEFVVTSVTFEGVFNRVMLRARHSNTSIEAIVPEATHLAVGQEVSAAISAERIMFFKRDGKRVNK